MCLLLNMLDRFDYVWGDGVGSAHAGNYCFLRGGQRRAHPTRLIYE